MRLIAALSLLAALLGAPEHQEAPLDPGYWDRTPLPQMGLATYYGSGVMQWVESYRRGRNQLPPCPECVGSVALLRAGDIGRKVWLQHPNGELYGPFLVIDCAQQRDIPSLLNREWAVDVSWELSRAWRMNRPLAGVIVWPDPSEQNLEVPAPRPPTLLDPDEVVITQPTPMPGDGPPELAAVLAQLTPRPLDPVAEGTPAPTSLLEQAVPAERLSPRPTPEPPAPAMARAGAQLLPTPTRRSWATRAPDEAPVFGEGPIIADLLPKELPVDPPEPVARPTWFASLWDTLLAWLGS